MPFNIPGLGLGFGLDKKKFQIPGLDLDLIGAGMDWSEVKFLDLIVGC